jgi:predicted ATPase/Tfp pilus assembly protein PilF
MDPSPSPSPDPAPAWPDAAPPPEAAWPLIGRDVLVHDLVDRVTAGDSQAVVLSGLGGVGKTRLAAEVARAVAPTLDGRVAWIQLSQAPHDTGLGIAVAMGLGITGIEPDEVAEAIVTAIGEEPALLVLDGAEAALHDLDIVDHLLDLAPSVRLLVTSRIAIERSRFVVVPIGGLALPDAGAAAEAVASSPAVELLVDRARRAGADIAITARTAPAIARLAGRLDGMPLAIELAAPLLRVLPPHRLLDRTDARLDAVRATIDWSHDQLEPDDRRLYRRLAVFGVPFRARHVRTFAERSLAHGLAPLGSDLEGGLERLVAAGLVRSRPDADRLDPATGPDDPRGTEVHEYELPALIRDDAMRRLDASGEGTAAMWARANDLLALCELSHAELVVRARLDLLDQLDIVHADLVAVLDQARGAGEGAFLLRMAGALSEYWRTRGHLAEGRVWLDTALRLGPSEPTAERARALHGAGMLANWQSDFHRARAVLEEALAIRLAIGELAEAAATLNQLGLIGLDVGELEVAERHCRQGLDIRRSLGDESAIAASLNTLGGILQFGGRTDEAGALFEESVAIRRLLRDDAGCSVSLANLALVARDRGDLDAAEAMLRESRATRERLGDRQRVAVVRHNLALVLFDRGDLGGARVELEVALATARELGDRLETANALSDLGFVEAAAGERERAATLQGEALVVAARIGAKGIVAQSIDGVAGLMAADGQVGEAATLWAAAESIRREARYHLLQADRRRTDREIEAARAAVDEEAWRQAWAAGEALAGDVAIERAQAALASTGPTSGEAGRVAV